MPTHQDEYFSERQDYFLQGGNELVVPLKWIGSNSLSVTKNFRFKPNSYIIEVDYEISNNSSSDQVVSSLSLIHI